MPQKNLYFNGEAVQIFHQPATTDGNSIVLFRRSDVISTGDIFDPTQYPIIDVKNGGSLQGVLEGLNRLRQMAVPADHMEGGTMIVPGHGRVCDMADLDIYQQMVTIVRDRLQDMIKSGMTLDQVKAARPTRDYDPVYGSNTGNWTTEMFIEAAYNSLSSKPDTRGAREVSRVVMKYRRLVLVSLIALMLLTLGGGLALAHHSATATYIHGKSVKIEGTLKEFIWRNPHSFIKVEAPDEKGEMQIWVIEGAAPGQLAEQGLTTNRLRPGDHVIVTGQPGRIAEDHDCCSRPWNGHRTASSGRAPRRPSNDTPMRIRTHRVFACRRSVVAARCRPISLRNAGTQGGPDARAPGRFHRILGIGRHRTVALPDAGARQRRLHEDSAQPRRPQNRGRVGSRQRSSERQRVQGIRCCRDPAGAGAAAHLLAGRQHAANGYGLRNPDSPVPFRWVAARE